MRRAAVVVLLLAASCTAPSTTIEIHAPSVAHATVSYRGRSTTLDAHGDGVLEAPLLHVVVEGFGAEIGNSFVSADGTGPLVLHVERDGHAIDQSPVCVPIYVDEGPVEVVRLEIRRVLSDHACRIVNPSIVKDGVEVASTEYAANRAQFDDYACGPFAAIGY
jgi:hypothetical protein